jgi:glycosyltransferase involved in cell wall biosynthesis
MARGLPVVATRVGGLPEVVADGVTGLLVPPADPAALARAIVHIGRDPECGLRMGQAGRRRVEQHFEIRRMVADYEALYLDQMARPNQAQPVSSDCLGTEVGQAVQPDSLGTSGWRA